ncbi:dihydrolipoyllysine-residue succinyltransferase component of 2-oxoglutarate dehydrogenase complex [Rhodococcus ruber BKS 20-38]|uniref:Dihydrolipoyllysine-residue succinyltransferase component of 2-oxoglutarate dehydrogenase complex n=1 Tax=Rhodococcus ruber BKS 20-38 TaxID=1278076 RepID=M3A2T8_9NOCA|nr:2-oxo acid dehydrogenase subunit E2 [Rhodococcus ruber]EME67278.1 dihydrolipoyllysine-residue succinyltransferase component of 2-oxoglutarate dehydrogenase complex [Rhodococcus ruber BKS 20-38]
MTQIASAFSPLRGTSARLTRLRKVIARRMVDSLQTSAQLTTVVEVDMTGISDLRTIHKESFRAREGVALSYLPFFAKAALEALRIHPVINAELDMEAGTVTYPDAEHLSVAVDTDRGLFVPVLPSAGNMTLGELARGIDDLAARTREGIIAPDEMSGGTFTITNTGSRGALFDTPIINQPQSAILGTGAVVRRPAVVRDGDGTERIVVRSIAYLALSYDHRIIDGADAARYLTTVKDRLEGADFTSELTT